MAESLKTVLYPVKDAEKAKPIFTALLGAEPFADSPYYVGYKADGQDVGLVPGGHGQGLTGPTAYLHVPDIKARLDALVAAGAKVVQEPHEVGGGRQVALVTDPDGNGIGLIQDAA